jgi:hypothetical protein
MNLAFSKIFDKNFLLSNARSPGRGTMEGADSFQEPPPDRGARLLAGSTA